MYFKYVFVCNFLPCSTIFHLYDGGQFLLVEERTLIHYTMYLCRDHRPSANKIANFLTRSHPYEQDSNRRGLEMRGLRFSNIYMWIMISNNFTYIRIAEYTCLNLEVFSFSELRNSIFVGNQNSFSILHVFPTHKVSHTLYCLQYFIFFLHNCILLHYNVAYYRKFLYTVINFLFHTT
jgi:hypothetical protein